MNGEIKQCANCGLLYPEYKLEKVFTGRVQLICYKCAHNGLKQTGTIVQKHYTKKLNNGGTK